MDPLSIAASVAGLLALSLQLASAIGRFTTAYEIAKSVHQELLEFHGILSELNSLVFGSSFSDINRASMIELGHVEVTLVGCIYTFSELEKEVNRLGTVGSRSLIDRAKWTLSQSTLTGLIQRLQNHKASLSAMLAIMTRKSLDEAIQCLAELKAITAETLRRVQESDVHTVAPSMRTGVPSIAGSSRSLRSIPIHFETVLMRTKLYRRSLRSGPAYHESGELPGSTGFSVLSGRSLSEISNIAVYELCISLEGLYNPYWYNLLPAVVEGKTDIVSFILSGDIAVKRKWRSTTEALTLAIKGGHAAIVRILLEYGAVLDATDHYSGNGLYLAFSQGVVNQEVVHALMEHCVDSEILSATLLEAIGRRSSIAVNTILQHAPDLASHDCGRAAMQYAANYGHPDIVETLLNQHVDIEAKVAVRSTALHLSLLGRGKEQLEVVKLLLKRGADTEVRNYEGDTPLHSVVRNQGNTMLRNDFCVPFVQLLLEHGANAEARTKNGSSPIHLALGLDGSELLQVAKLLLQHGADKDVKNSAGNTPLHLAARTGRDIAPKIMQLLLEHGANKEAKNIAGDTCLHVVCGTDNAQTMKILLDHGAETDTQNAAGETPLDIVIRANGDGTEAEVLLRSYLRDTTSHDNGQQRYT